MGTLLHNPYLRSPNPSTRSFDSASVSSASPRLATLHGRFLAGALDHATAGARSDPSAAVALELGRRAAGGPGIEPSTSPSSSSSLPLPPGPQHVSTLPPLASLHKYEYGHDHDHGHKHKHEHEHKHAYEHHHRRHPSSVLYSQTPSHHRLYCRFSPVMDGRGDSLPLTDSLTSTPGPGYVALPPMHHAGSGGASSGYGGGGSSGAMTAASAVSASAPPMAMGITPLQQQQQQQQQQHRPPPPHLHHQQQKRAYRQRRKDPSCDACRERKVKCDATETTSCSECSSRQVNCQFTKETNRRMSSIKHMQDLERQVFDLRRENDRLHRALRRGTTSSGAAGGPIGPVSSAVTTDAPSDTTSHMLMDLDGVRRDHIGPHDHPARLRHLDTDGGPGLGLSLLTIPDIGFNPPRRRLPRRHRQQQQPPTPSSPDLSRARSKLCIFAKGFWVPPAPFDVPAATPITSPASPVLRLPQTQPRTLPQMPSRDAANVWLRSYYTSVHSMFPMIHWPTFQRQVDELYQQPQQPSHNTAFTALYFSVLAVGSLFCTPLSEDPVSPITPAQLADTARQQMNPWSLRSVSHASSSTHALDDTRTLLLLALFLHESNLDAAAWTWLGCAVRTAQSLGLYMEPDPATPTQGGFGPLEAEMRRRVWWAVYVVDRTLATTLGSRPMLIHDDDCDVALPAAVDDHFLVDGGVNDMLPGTVGVCASIPPDAKPLTQPFLAVLHVVRTYTALSQLLSAASTAVRVPPSSSPVSTSSPSLATAATASLASSVFSGTSIPATHLATFDQHFASCLRVFPPPCDPANHHDGTVTLPAALLSPLVYLLHARLVLHRHNLAPHRYAPGPTAAQARLSAVEQCTHTALETVTLVRRVPPNELANGIGATALLATHMARCTLFLLLGGHADAAIVLVRALAAIAAVRRAVAVPCGRFLSFFASCLAFKRAEYTAYLQRTAAPTSSSDARPSSMSSPSSSSTSRAPQLYEALMCDEELLVYVSADLQSSPEHAWVWEGGDATTVMATAASTTTSTVAMSSAAASGGSLLAGTASLTGLTDEESRDWSGWEGLESRVRSLVTASGTSTPVPTPTTTPVAPGMGAGPGPCAAATAPTAPVPPPTSYSTTTADTTSPVTHYTYQPPAASTNMAMDMEMTVKQEHAQYGQPLHIHHSPHPQQHQQQPQKQYQQQHHYPYTGPSPSTYEHGGGHYLSQSSPPLPPSLPPLHGQLPLPLVSTTEPRAGIPAIEDAVTSGSSAGGNNKSKNQERLKIANII